MRRLTSISCYLCCKAVSPSPMVVAALLQHDWERYRPQGSCIRNALAGPQRLALWGVQADTIAMIMTAGRTAREHPAD